MTPVRSSPIKGAMKQVPVIDITHLHNGPTLKALDDACRHWGFFQVVGHGIASDVFRALTASMHDFFGQPQALKQKVERSAQNPWGYYDRELTKNVRDWKEVFDVGPKNAQETPQWPEDLPDFQPALERFYSEAERVSRMLLEAIARNLDEEPYVLLSAFEDHTSFLRLNYYPPCPDPASSDAPTIPETGKLGIGHHSDAGVLTVLYQDAQPGLQVEHNGQWYTVEPRHEALVINLGDIVQVWSNDRYQAALHRVLANSDTPRYSAPFFFNPAYAANYGPLESVCQNQAPRYRAINWGEFRGLRAAGDYADYGEEIQISHYQIEP